MKKWIKAVIALLILLASSGLLFAAFHVFGNSEKAVSEKEKMYEYETAEIWCENQGQRIYGIAYTPVTEEKVPLVIFAHELGNTHHVDCNLGAEYACLQRKKY